VLRGGGLSNYTYDIVNIQQIYCLLGIFERARPSRGEAEGHYPVACEYSARWSNLRMLLHGARIDTERLISSTEIVDVGLFFFWSRESVIRPLLLQWTCVCYDAAQQGAHKLQVSYE
jgi:hypothetical protein